MFVISNWLAARYDSKALCVPVITPCLHSLLPAVSAWLSQCLPYFWSMVTVGFDKREASAPVDSLAKCRIGMPFIHFLWFTCRSLKFSDLVLLGTFLIPLLTFLNGCKVQIFSCFWITLVSKMFNIILNPALCMSWPICPAAFNKELKEESLWPGLDNVVE